MLACKSSKPTLEIINKCHAANSDGAGIVWFDDTNLAKYKKGLNPTELFEIVEKLPLPFCIHFRASSPGFSKSNLLTHPFEVTEKSELKLEGECEKLLMHNGYISDWKMFLAARNLRFETNEVSSDSRAVARIISNDNQEFLKETIKDTNKGKFIFIDAVRKKFGLYGDSFNEDNGILYSNLTWKHGKSYCQTSTNVGVGTEYGSYKEAKEKIVAPITSIVISNQKDADGILKPFVLNGDDTKKKISNPDTLTSLTSGNEAAPVSPEEVKIILQRFSCPPNLSKEKQKKLFKRYCKISCLC